MPDTKRNRQDHDRHAGVQGRLPLQTRHKIAISFGLLLLVVTAAYWLLSRSELDRSLQQYNDILGASLAEHTAASVRELVLVNDLLGLNVVLTQLVSDETIRFASVHDVDGEMLASAGQQEAPVDTDGLYTADITVQDAIAGAVSIRLNVQVTDDYRNRLRNLYLLILAVAMVLVITTAYALAGRITVPLQNLADAINGSMGADGESDDPVDETGRLQESVDRLLSRYQEMEGQLLETGVWHNRSGDITEPSRLAASILVIKVVNVHTAIELLHPATLSGLLQEYLFYLNQAAKLYGGAFYRIHGESVVVCFDEESCGDNHSINALYCAGLFQSLMTKVNNRHRKKGEQILEFRMAIHSGDIFLAPGIGANGQADKASILGKTLDVTYYLSKQGEPGELVISESTCSQAREHEHFDTDREREVSMPADNVTFMAYILTGGFAEDMGMIRKQRRHILGTPDSDARGSMEG